ncbi:hypothetical protein EYF80_024405 [Liparis tanakae]|uniref:Uncharacterized protein n=1 Tax=Liparis tanakae TaxID=230148 RepID=A0A4Z2HHJ5_9TELE|nr:hypothetical protein EYF80_024405 [Liparis tanakae]
MLFSRLKCEEVGVSPSTRLQSATVTQNITRTVFITELNARILQSVRSDNDTFSQKDQPREAFYQRRPENIWNLCRRPIVSLL